MFANPLTLCISTIADPDCTPNLSLEQAGAHVSSFVCGTSVHSVMLKPLACPYSCVGVIKRSGGPHNPVRALVGIITVIIKPHYFYRI